MIYLLFCLWLFVLLFAINCLFAIQLKERMIKTANQEFIMSAFYGERDIKIAHFIFCINFLKKICSLYIFPI